MQHYYKTVWGPRHALRIQRLRVTDRLRGTPRRTPHIDLDAPLPNDPEIHSCGQRYAFITDGFGHCSAVCDRCHVLQAFGR